MVQDNGSLRKLCIALTAALLLNACSLLAPHAPSSQPASSQPALGQPSPSQPAPGQPAPGQPSPYQSPSQPPPARQNHLSAATRSLVTQAHAQLTNGDLPAASSTLDRALRIEPNSPLLWIELGRLRLAESDAHQAEGCARKALALASGDRDALAQSGRLLADALRAQRRNQEAREIESQPYMH